MQLHEVSIVEVYYHQMTQYGVNIPPFNYYSFCKFTEIPESHQFHYYMFNVNLMSKIIKNFLYTLDQYHMSNAITTYSTYHSIPLPWSETYPTNKPRCTTGHTTLDLDVIKSS